MGGRGALVRSLRYSSAVLVRPRYWRAALGVALAMRPRRGRGLVPSAEYLDFRTQTLAGDGRLPTTEEFLDFIEWADRYRRL
jgi:hypothetical protein